MAEDGEYAGIFPGRFYAPHGLPNNTFRPTLFHREFRLQGLNCGAIFGVKFRHTRHRLTCAGSGGLALCSGVGFLGERGLGQRLNLVGGQVFDAQRGTENAVYCGQDTCLDLVVHVAQSADLGQGACGLGHDHLFNEVGQQLITEHLGATLHVADRDALVRGLRHLGFDRAVTLLHHGLQASDDGIVLLRADQVLHTQVGTDLVQGNSQHLAFGDTVGVQGDGLAVIQTPDLAAIWRCGFELDLARLEHAAQRCTQQPRHPRNFSLHRGQSLTFSGGGDRAAFLGVGIRLQLSTNGGWTRNIERRL